jgi:hypothetical protein
MAKYKLISCNVFQRELCAAISVSPNVIDPEFLELGLHLKSESLRSTLQARIDLATADSELAAAEGGTRGAYDAVLLGYGLCGNGLAGVQARSLPLVMPRAHDCCTVLLGSRAAFEERFGSSPSASWSSSGYIERGTGYFRASELEEGGGVGMEYDKLVELYGEENARYVWDTLHPELDDPALRFIELEETASLGYADRVRAEAAEQGKEFLLLPGSSRLLRALVAGSWDEEEFLVVPPGAKVSPLYDHEKVFEAAAGEP